MDASSRRPQLPALSYLEMDKPKREEETYQGRNGAATPTRAGFVASALHQYPPGPPPPYSHSASQQQSNSWPGANGTVHTPPESRRTSGEEHNIKQSTRQLLPSISEAIGPLNDHVNLPPVTISHEPLPPGSAQVPTPQSGVPPSPLNSRPSYPIEPHISQPSSQFNAFRQDSAGPQMLHANDRAAPTTGYGQPDESRYPLPAQDRHQSSHTHPYNESTSARYEPQGPTTMPPPPPSTFAYGYTSHQRYAQSSQPSTSGPIFQPSALHAAPTTPTPVWKQDDGSSRYSDSSAPYSDHVKRRLETYDFEASLSEIIATSTAVQEFGKRYGSSVYQSARNGGPTMSQLPGIVEIDDMINKSRIQLDSLAKIREVVLAEQAVYQQQMADQRHKAYAEPNHTSAPQHREDEDESRGGFAGGENKKRRGRAAPPGRCHSCNRAETPEWRRGPDGARTLCNACGLHYAKLTRKQTNVAKGGAAGSSNLRPKEA